jgi:hypothetical protein
MFEFVVILFDDNAVRVSKQVRPQDSIGVKVKFLAVCFVGWFIVRLSLNDTFDDPIIYDVTRL